MGVERGLRHLIEDDIELDLYSELHRQDQRHVRVDRRRHLVRLPDSAMISTATRKSTSASTPASSASSSGTADDFYALGDSAMYTEGNYTATDRATSSRWPSTPVIRGATTGTSVRARCRLRRAAQLHRRPLHDLRQVHRHGCQRPGKVEGDVSNNEPRVLIGVMTTFPWGK